ncbi:MAG: hypothetical protein V3V01_03120 [Acidimicrobiales bacterium]
MAESPSGPGGALSELGQDHTALPPLGLECLDGPYEGDTRGEAGEPVDLVEVFGLQTTLLPLDFDVRDVGELGEWLPGSSESDLEQFTGVVVSDSSEVLAGRQFIFSNRSLGAMVRRVEKDPGLQVLVLSYVSAVDNPSRADLLTFDSAGVIDALFDCASNYSVELNLAAERVRAGAKTMSLEDLQATFRGDESNPLYQEVLNPPTVPVELDYYSIEAFLEPGFRPPDANGEGVWAAIYLPEEWIGEGLSDFSVCLRSSYGLSTCVAVNASIHGQPVAEYVWIDELNPIEIWLDRHFTEDDGPKIGPVVQIGTLELGDIDGTRVVDELPLVDLIVPAFVETVSDIDGWVSEQGANPKALDVVGVDLTPLDEAE